MPSLPSGKIGVHRFIPAENVGRDQTTPEEYQAWCAHHPFTNRHHGESPVIRFLRAKYGRTEPCEIMYITNVADGQIASFGYECNANYGAHAWFHLVGLPDWLAREHDRSMYISAPYPSLA